MRSRPRQGQWRSSALVLGASAAAVAVGCFSSSGSQGHPDASGPDDGPAAEDAGPSGETGAMADSSPDSTVSDASDAQGVGEAGPDGRPVEASADALADGSQPPGTCVSTGGMGAKRVGPGALLLSNGSVLVAGGIDTSTGTVLGSAELYDPTLGTFHGTGAMATPRVRHTLTALPGGKVLAVGGVNAAGTPQSTAETYDPLAGTWSPAASMSVARMAHGALALGDGRVLVFGGFSVLASYNLSTNSFSFSTAVSPASSAEIYDPVADAFAPTGSMTLGRALAGASLLADGRALVAGGLIGQAGPTGSVETFNGADGGADAGFFASAGTLPNGVVGLPVAATLPSGAVFILPLGNAVQDSGVTTGGPVYFYDPGDGGLSTGPADLMGANAGLQMPGGDIFFACGGGTAAPTPQTEVYRAASNAWNVAGDMSVVRRGPALANLSGGRVLVAGGCQQNSCGSTALASAEICTP